MKTITTGLLCLLLACAVALAQTSQISGTVRDTSGLAIPGAAIKATQTATGVIRSTSSGADGSYVLPNLPIGPYLLEVTKEGFSRSVQSGIVLQVDTTPTVDIAMRVGAVNEQVTVEAVALQVETRTTSIGGVVDNKQITEMPLNGRDPHELVFLAGMASYPGDGSMNSIRNYPTVVVSVAGGNGDGVAYLLDGVIHQDPYNSLSLPLPFPDALQEFKVETSAVPAQYGYHATATVNAVTKSGSNQFHGDLFEFLRNGDLNARDFFAVKRDTLKRNQFGGTIGGPIRKDKLFFFGGYQRTSLRSDPVQNTAFVPTPAQISGDFSTSAVRLKDPRDPSGLTFFPNNQVPASLLSPVTQNIVKTFPTALDATGRTINGQVGGQDEDLITAKIDWQISTKHSFYGRYLDAKLDKRSTFDGKNPLSISFFGVQPRDYGFALGDTWLISPNVVSSLRVGANRTNVPKISDNYASWSSLGANITPLAGNIIGLNISGTGIVFGGGNASPGAQHNGPLWSALDDISWVKGSHEFGFGGSIFQQRLNYWSGTNAVGVATFDGSVTGLPLADFVLGRAVTFSQGTNYGFYTRQYYMSLYAQDSWKISRRLTLNYGVRWEPYLAPYNNRGENQHFDPTLFTQNVHSQVFTNAPAGLVFPGDAQYTCGDYFNCPRWNKFFPRIGLAWDPLGNGRMTVRAGYGIYGDRAMMLAGSAMYFDPPFGNTLNLSGVDLQNPWTNYPGATGLPAGQNPMPTLASLAGIGVYNHSLPFPAFGGYVNSPLKGFNPVYMNQWNLSIEKQVGENWLISANYVGNSTIHMVSGENVNLATYIPGNCVAGQYGLRAPGLCSTTANINQRRVLYLENAAQGQGYSGIGQIDDGGTQTYDGLNLSARRQLRQGFTAGVNYTWAHCIGDPYNQNPPAGAGVAIPGNRRQWRSNCAGPDVRQLLNLNVVATTPKFSSRALRIVAGDWQVAPILSIRSAQLFTVTSGVDNAVSGQGNQTPNLVIQNPYPQNQNVDHWLITTAPAAPIKDSAPAFVAAAAGTYGNLGYNNLKGPGVFQLNLALSRNFLLGERRTVQLRGEAFNLPNHLNPLPPGNGIGIPVALNSPNFGRITNDISGNNGIGAGDYRVIQLAMKFVF
jgi:hypothetical protein